MRLKTLEDAHPTADVRVLHPTLFLVMGVSGSGKSTVGALLAQTLNIAFADADAFHSPQNIAKMRSGAALTDEDRVEWLAAVAACIAHWRDAGQGGVMACSALKRRYRRQIQGESHDVQLVYLQAPVALVRARLGERRGHFMPPTLLDSQFDALQEPLPDEEPIVVRVTGSPSQAVETILKARLGRGTADPPPPGRAGSQPADAAAIRDWVDP